MISHVIYSKVIIIEVYHKCDSYWCTNDVWVMTSAGD